METFKFFIDEKYDKTRLDVAVSELSGFTRSRVKSLLLSGNVSVNGEPEKSGKTLKTGDTVVLVVPDLKPVDLEPNHDIPLNIVYEDDDLLVINKQRGLTVHAGAGTGNDTLVNALLARVTNLSGINGEIRPGIVHRIDKNTTGLLVVAKNDEAHRILSSEIEKKDCKRIYFAILEGVVKEDIGTIDAPIGRDKKDRKKMAVVGGGRSATTDFTVLERFERNTFCRFSLRTGRTHQIRVHAKYIGHPVVGDPEYGYKSQRFNVEGQLLHAGELSFLHPKTGERLTFSAPLPEDFERILEILRKKS